MCILNICLSMQNAHLSLIHKALRCPPPLPRGKQTQIKMDRISPGESSLFRNQKPLSSHYIFYLGKKHGTGKATLIFKCDKKCQGGETNFPFHR